MFPRRITESLRIPFSKRIAGEGASLLVVRYTGAPRAVSFSHEKDGARTYAYSGLFLDFPSEFFTGAGDLWLHNETSQPGKDIVFTVSTFKGRGLQGIAETNAEIPAAGDLLTRQFYNLDGAFTSNIHTGFAGFSIERYTGKVGLASYALWGPEAVETLDAQGRVIDARLKKGPDVPIIEGEIVVGVKPLGGITFKNLSPQPGEVLRVILANVEGINSLRPSQRVLRGDSLAGGSATIGLTRVRLPNKAVAPGGKIRVWADAANTGTVYVGSSVVSVSNGFPLPKGATERFSVRDASSLWFVADLDGQAIRYCHEAEIGLY